MHESVRQLSILNHNGATSGFEICFGWDPRHLWCRGSQPKHVSNQVRGVPTKTHYLESGAMSPNQNTSRIQHKEVGFNHVLFMIDPFPGRRRSSVASQVWQPNRMACVMGQFVYEYTHLCLRVCVCTRTFAYEWVYVHAPLLTSGCMYTHLCLRVGVCTRTFAFGAQEWFAYIQAVE